MRIGYAEQYNKTCIILELGDDIDNIIEYAELEDAIFWEVPDEKSFVLQFPDRPMELYSKSALRRSMPIKA